MKHSKDELEKLLLSDDANVVIDAIMYLCFNIDDPEWIQRKCVQLIESGKNDDIRGLAITCIGHTARIHQEINKDLVIPILLDKLQDSALSGRAEDALGDIKMFVKK
jgi:hypothetical protein